MAMRYDALDIYLTEEGDLSLYKGEVESTASDLLLSVAQGIRERWRTNKGEWRVDPSLGLLEGHLGLMNTQGEALRWKGVLLEALTRDGYIDPNDITIDIIPVSDVVWVVAAVLRAAPTPENGGRTSVRLLHLAYLDKGELVYP